MFQAIFDLISDLVTGDFFSLILKGLLVVFLGIIGIIQVIRYSIRQQGLNRVVRKSKASAVYASDVIDTLDFCYGAFPIKNYHQAIDLVREISENQHLGTYKIDKIIAADPSRFLCPAYKEIIAFKEHSDESYHAGYELVLFAIVLNEEKSQIEVYSESYDDVGDKTDKTKFKTELKNYFEALKLV